MGFGNLVMFSTFTSLERRILPFYAESVGKLIAHHAMGPCPDKVEQKLKNISTLVGDLDYTRELSAVYYNRGTHWDCYIRENIQNPSSDHLIDL